MFVVLQPTPKVSTVCDASCLRRFYGATERVTVLVIDMVDVSGAGDKVVGRRVPRFQISGVDTGKLRGRYPEPGRCKDNNLKANEADTTKADNSANLSTFVRQTKANGFGPSRCHLDHETME